MRYFVGIEDLVSNALIELLENNKDGQVSFSDLYTYGEAVVKMMCNDKLKAVLVLSRYHTESFLYDCSDYFEIVDDSAIKIKADKTIDDLKSEFRSKMSFEILKACLNPESLKALKIVA